MLTIHNKTFTTKYGTINTTIEAFVEEERNGLFELSFIMLNTDNLFNYVKEDNIVVANANNTLLNQKFRIYMTRKLMNNRVEVFARHISFDLMYDYIDSVKFNNQSCEYALNQLFRNSNFSKHYKGYSDIVNAQNYSMSTANVLEAIGGKEGSVLDTYGTGAELLRDNENIHVLNKRGHDNSVSIEYKKNLTGFELEEDTTELITRILPYAKYTPKDSEGNSLDEVIVKASFVDSSLMSNYSHPFIKAIDYSDKFDDENIPTVDKLKALAELEYKNNKVDKPKQNFKIEFIPLSKCVGYEGLSDNISLCDTVTIKDTRHNINTQAKVIKITYNLLKNRYEYMELGEPKTSLADIVGGNSGEASKGEQGPPGPQGPAGVNGTNGTNGVSATAYWLISSASAIGKNTSNVFNPTSITFTLKSQTGTSAVANYSGRLIIAESTDGTNFTNKYTSSANEASKTYSPSSTSVKSIRVRMYQAGGTSVLLDEQLIPIVVDGTNGTNGINGTNGKDAVTAVLSNESHNIPCNTSGTPTTYAGAVTTMSVFVGASDTSSSWTYSVSTSSVTGKSSNSNRTYTVTGISADTGYVDITATRSGYSSVTKRFTLTKSKQGATGATGPQGPTGATGPQGPPGADGDIGDFPNTLPSTPVVTAKVYGFANIEISWTFENQVYYQYEVYASKQSNFTPNSFNLIHSGQTSTYMYQAKPNETWYFKVCCINSHGKRTSFGSAYATTTKIDDLSNYVSEMAIGEALIGTLSLDRGWIGKLNANLLDVKGNFSVTDGNGKRTLDIDSFGNVNLDVASLKIASKSAATQDYTNNLVNTAKNEAINNSNKYTDTIKTELSSKIEVTSNKISQEVKEVKTTADGALTKASSVEQTANSLTTKVTSLDSKYTEIKQTANSLTTKVTSIDNKYTEIKQTIDGIDLTGKVSFSDLSTSGKTTINGGNITSGTIRGINIISTNTDSEQRCAMLSDGMRFYSPTKQAGRICFDSNGEGTSTSAKNRFLIQSLDGYVLKLLSTGNMSLTSYDVMYLEGNKVQTNCNLDLTGNRLDCGNIYCSNNITCTSLTLTNGITAPSVSATTIEAKGTLSGKTGSFNELNANTLDVTSSSWLNSVSCTSISCSSIRSTGIIYTTGSLQGKDCAVANNMSVDNNAWIKYLYVNGVQVTSDQTLKMDIKRVNIDKQTISEDSGLMSPNVNITTQDMHEFIETLPIVSYRLIDDVEKGKDETYYGFLAQEILYSKAGSELISVPTEEEQELVGDKLRYSVTNYISFIAGALQEEIRKRKDLETKIDNLAKAIDNLK